jgi:hypothetical protein
MGYYKKALYMVHTFVFIVFANCLIKRQEIANIISK